MMQKSQKSKEILNNKSKLFKRMPIFLFMSFFLNFKISKIKLIDNIEYFELKRQIQLYKF